VTAPAKGISSGIVASAFLFLLGVFITLGSSALVANLQGARSQYALGAALFGLVLMLQALQLQVSLRLSAIEKKLPGRQQPPKPAP
jgi:hypothetical protein